MKILVIEEQDFSQMKEHFTRFAAELAALCDPSEKRRYWLDNQEVCELLCISKRTLQYYRDSGTLPFSQLGHKCYYKPADVEKLIEKSYIKPNNHGRTGN